VNDLRFQICGLTNADLGLCSSLKKQSGTIVKLQAGHERLRNETKTGISKPSSEPKPSPKQAAP
jgi:hypothetical protein